MNDEEPFSGYLIIYSCFLVPPGDLAHHTLTHRKQYSVCLIVCFYFKALTTRERLLLANRKEVVLLLFAGAEQVLVKDWLLEKEKAPRL
jgi:hypothetical protein